MALITLLYIYVAFRMKHLMCDFILQTDWMALGKGEPGRLGMRALVTHTFIHALGTLIITMFFAPALWWLAIVDFVVHSIIDRLKGAITHRKQWKSSDTAFWWAFAVDQELHNYTHLVYIIIIVLHQGGIIS